MAVASNGSLQTRMVGYLNDCNIDCFIIGMFELEFAGIRNLVNVSSCSFSGSYEVYKM